MSVNGFKPVIQCIVSLSTGDFFSGRAVERRVLIPLLGNACHLKFWPQKATEPFVFDLRPSEQYFCSHQNAPSGRTHWTPAMGAGGSAAASVT